MADENKRNIWIRLADTQPISLSVNAADETTFQEAERLVNTLYEKWMLRFGGNSTPHDVLARVAFQFARLYLETYGENHAVNDYLTEFERQLDDLVVKL